jgi:hypothetical protein
LLCFLQLIFEKEKLLLNVAGDPRVTEYIRKELAVGYSFDGIKTALLKQGWFEREIAEALKVA